MNEDTNTTKVPDEKTVWIACRATDGCKGNHAVIVSHRPVKDGMIPQGSTIRYRCTTCNRPFHVHR